LSFQIGVEFGWRLFATPKTPSAIELKREIRTLNPNERARTLLPNQE
jgi:hypothetical protein